MTELQDRVTSYSSFHLEKMFAGLWRDYQLFTLQRELRDHQVITNLSLSRRFCVQLKKIYKIM